MTVILIPRCLTGKNISVVPLKHPKTQDTKDFVISGPKLWQVVSIVSPEKSYKSLFIENSHQLSVHSADTKVLVPVNPLFLLLPAIYASKSLPLDILLDLSAGEWLPLPVEMARTSLELVCDFDDDLVTLNPAKLDKWLVQLVAKVPVPDSFVIRDLDAEFSSIYQKFVAVNFISSWLPQSLVDHLNTLIDFTALQAHAQQVIKSREQANTMYVLNSRAATPAATAKRTKKDPKTTKRPANNKSLLDMFTKKPKK